MEFRLHYCETTCPKVQEIPGARGICYWLREPIVWVDEEGKHHEVPVGFVNDGFSIPSFAKGVIRGLKSRVPAYVHDWQFLTHEAGSLKLTNYNIRRGIVLTGGGRWNAMKAGTGLWLGGWYAWGQYGYELETLGYDAVVRRRIAETETQAIRIANIGRI